MSGFENRLTALSLSVILGRSIFERCPGFIVEWGVVYILWGWFTGLDFCSRRFLKPYRAFRWALFIRYFRMNSSKSYSGDLNLLGVKIDISSEFNVLSHSLSLNIVIKLRFQIFNTALTKSIYRIPIHKSFNII